VCGVWCPCVRVCACMHRGPHSQGLLEGRINPLQPTQLRESEREKKKKKKKKTKKKKKVREIAEKEKGPVKKEIER
jgi:aryl-alcohol dehydrogenase-like predicted oxidoreductase